MAPNPEMKKTTRKRLTIAQKLEIASLLNDGHRTTAIMRQFGVAERTVRNLKSTAPDLFRIANERPKSLNTETRQPVMVPRLEPNLLEFLDYARSAKMPVT